MTLLKKILINAIKIGITSGILFYLYQRGMLDFTRVRTVFSNTVLITFVFLILIGTNTAAVLRWSWLLKGQKLLMPFFEVFRLTMIGVFFNTALPGAVSGDVVKGYYVVRLQPNKRGRIKAFTTLLMDRLLGVSALICVSFAAMVVNYKSIAKIGALKPFCGLITVLWLGVVVFYLFMLVEWPFTEKMKKFFHRFPVGGDIFGRLFEAFKAYETCKTYILKGLAISMLIHTSIVLAFILLARNLPGFETISVHNFFFLVPFGLLVTAIPIAPAGLGTGHAAFFGLFQLVGSKSGADLFTAFVSFQILISLLGGLFYLKNKSKMPVEFEYTN